MSEDESELQDALTMMGAGYEFHAGEPYVTEGEDGLPEVVEGQPWIKLSMAFLKTMPKLKGAKLSVWLAIALRINKSYMSYPSIKRICDDTGLSNRAVIDTIKELEESGYLTVKRRDRRVNIYQVRSYAAFGDAAPVIPSSEESSQGKSKLVNSVPKLVNSTTQTGEESSHELDSKRENNNNLQKNKISPITDKALDLKDNIPLEWRVASGQPIQEKDLCRPPVIPGAEYFTQYHPDELRYAEPFSAAFGRGPISKSESKLWREWIKNAQALKLTPQDLVEQITINWQSDMEVNGPQSVVKSAHSRKAKEAAGIMTKPKYEPKEAFLPQTTAIFADEE